MFNRIIVVVMMLLLIVILPSGCLTFENSPKAKQKTAKKNSTSSSTIAEQHLR